MASAQTDAIRARPQEVGSGQRPLQPLQHQRLIRPPREDRVDDVRRKQRQPQDPAHVALRDVLGVADLTDGCVDALIKHALPPPRLRQRLNAPAAAWSLA
jgi:hypothetical protein